MATRRGGKGFSFSVTWEGPDGTELDELLADELRETAIEAAQEAAEEASLGDEWEVPVTLDVDGAAFRAVVRKGAGSEPAYEQEPEPDPAD